MKPVLVQITPPNIADAAKVMAAQIEAQAHSQAHTKSHTQVEVTSTMPDPDEAPPTRLHDLALAETKMSVED